MIKKFFLRAICGLLLIFCVNQYLNYEEISLAVGINGITFLTCGTLGIPGAALLYGIMVLQIL